MGPARGYRETDLRDPTASPFVIIREDGGESRNFAPYRYVRSCGRRQGNVEIF